MSTPTRHVTFIHDAYGINPASLIDSRKRKCTSDASFDRRGIQHVADCGYGATEEIACFAVAFSLVAFPTAPAVALFCCRLSFVTNIQALSLDSLAKPAARSTSSYHLKADGVQKDPRPLARTIMQILIVLSIVGACFAGDLFDINPIQQCGEFLFIPDFSLRECTMIIHQLVEYLPQTNKKSSKS